jgi:hypothetical protein
MIRLEIIEAEGSRTQDVPKDMVHIGRDDVNDVVLTDPRISMQHCTIEKRGDNFLVRDLGSLNRVKFAGKKVSEAQLVVDQYFEIGKAQVWLRTPPPPDPDAPQQHRIANWDAPAPSESGQQEWDNKARIAANRNASGASWDDFDPYAEMRQHRERRPAWLLPLIVVTLMAIGGYLVWSAWNGSPQASPATKPTSRTS